MDERSNNGNGLAFFFGLLVGALVGGGLGLLFAPSKGEETRKKIKTSSKSLRDKAEKIYEDVKEATEPILEAVDEFEPLVSDVKNGALEEGESLKQSASEKISEISEGISTAKKRLFRNIRK